MQSRFSLEQCHADIEAYFNFVLMHEVSHGLGPGIIALPDGSKKQSSR